MSIISFVIKLKLTSVLCYPFLVESCRKGLKKMDKIKDFLHDNTDIFVALLIAFAMFSVVAVNLGDWFKLETEIVMAEEKTEEPETDIEEKEELPAPEAEKETEVAETPVAEIPVVETPVVSPTPTTVIVEIKRIVIPSGTTGSGIAKILQEKGLIASTSDFVRVAEELKLSPKLKSGTFEIPSNASIEEMVRTIAGQK